MASTVPGRHTDIQMRVLENGQRDRLEIHHETAHELRSHYQDEDQVDPVRVGRMRYGIITGPGGGGQAGGRAFLADASVYTVKLRKGMR